MDVRALQTEAESAIAAATTVAALDDVRVRYLGRKSDLAQGLRAVRDRESGMALNAARKALELAEAERRTALESAELERSLAEERVDVTLPGEAPARGHLHLITQIRREVEDIFLGLGYDVFDDREVQTVEDNFTALNFPEWHPARSRRSSFYVGDDSILRTETSPAQIHAMQTRNPPIFMVSIGRVYRRDTIDATHYPTFHQFEGLAIDKGITLAHLKGTLLEVMRQLYGPERAVRFRTHYFPFTEPSMEPDVSCMQCGGEGCRTCKFSGWLEMGGSGMVDPAVLEYCGLDPEEYSGFAFGMGLERTAQLRHGVNDIRLLWEGDLRVSRQF
ncbi:MAG: phenylalanine--tRNA ligase subunit alpha [Gaiellaceae bacterium]